MCYGPEFVAEAVQKWIAPVGAKTAYIERGSPWENGYIERGGVSSATPPATARAERRRNCAGTWRRPSGMRISNIITTNA